MRGSSHHLFSLQERQKWLLGILVEEVLAPEEKEAFLDRSNYDDGQYILASVGALAAKTAYRPTLAATAAANVLLYAAGKGEEKRQRQRYYSSYWARNARETLGAATLRKIVEATGSPPEDMPQAIQTALQATSDRPLAIRREARKHTSDPYKLIMQEVSQLSAEEEVDLAKQIEAGLLAGFLLRLQSPKPAIQEVARQELHTSLKAKARRLKYEYAQNTYKRNRLLPEVVDAESIVTTIEAFVRMAQTTPAEKLLQLQHEGKVAQQHFLEANLRLVFAMAKRYNRANLPFMDAVGIGNLALLKAVQGFDYRLGFKFSTYASKSIRGSLLTAMKKGGGFKLSLRDGDDRWKIRKVQTERLNAQQPQATPEEISDITGLPLHKVVSLLQYDNSPLSLSQQNDRNKTLEEAVPDKNFPPPSDIVVRRIGQREVERALRAIPPEYAELLEENFGIGMHPHTLAEMAESQNLTRTQINYRKKKALIALREVIDLELVAALI